MSFHRARSSAQIPLELRAGGSARRRAVRQVPHWRPRRSPISSLPRRVCRRSRPWVLAKHLGYYTEAGYDVDFVVARGGVDVAKQIGVGNAPIGGAIGDTPIIVRGNGVPVKAVGLMGGGALTVVVGRKDRGIDEARGPARQEDLRARLPGHDLLRAARRARLQEHHQERRQRAGGRAGGGREPGGRRHRRRLRLHAGLGDQRQGRRRGHGVAADQGLLPVDVAGDPGLGQDDRRAARTWCAPSSRRPCAA